MQMPVKRWIPTAALVTLVVVAPAVFAKEKKPKPAPKEPQDEISVVGHVPAEGTTIRRFVTTTHFSRYYLYGELADGTMTLLDVTKPSQPAVLANLAGTDTGAHNIVVVAGTAALVTDGDAPPAPPEPPQTIKILDFSDPRHPAAVREFRGVTAITRDDRRGLIFLANREGIWILHQNLALDPEVEKEYARRVLYDH
jgi:hypothetical protein